MAVTAGLPARCERLKLSIDSMGAINLEVNRRPNTARSYAVSNNGQARPGQRTHTICGGLSSQKRTAPGAAAVYLLRTMRKQTNVAAVARFFSSLLCFCRQKDPAHLQVVPIHTNLLKNALLLKDLGKSD